MNFERYALYYAPSSESSLGQFGNSWLGWNAESKIPVSRPLIEGLNQFEIETITKTPRRYGFHGTLKPPFRLNEKRNFNELDTAITELANELKPIKSVPLTLSKASNFLAFRPRDCKSAISAIADSCVSQLDGFRAESSPEELNKRRQNVLTNRQDDLLKQWGYPYVMDEFRFHITLSNKLESEHLDLLCKTLESHCDEILTIPFIIDSLCLFGDPGAGQPFHCIKRYYL